MKYKIKTLKNQIKSMKKIIKQIENGKYFEKSLEKFFWMNFILSDVERLDFIYKARNIIISKQ